MRTILAMIAGLGLIVACCECDFPLFPWVQLGGIATAAAAVIIYNRMEGNDVG